MLMNTQYNAKTILEFSEKNGRVVTDRTYTEGNARISSPMPNPDHEAYYFLITMGGGFIEGENYLIDVTVHDRASAILTSQAPTYIFRSLGGEYTKQNIELTLGQNATLEFLMDDLLPYKDAKFKQNTNIHLTSSSNLIYLDGTTSGWSPDEKLFTYDILKLDTKIYLDNKLVVNDHFLYEPIEYNDFNHLGLFESYTNYNTLIAINPKIDDEYIKNMRETLAKLDVQASFGVSKLECPGFILRILGKTIDDNKDVIYTCANKVRQDLFGFGPYELRKNDYKKMIS